jgi:hypothetical protein
MKLYGNDNSELMEVNAIRPQGKCVIIEGTIMGAMPIQAELRSSELRGALKLLNLKTVLSLIGMLFRK